MNPARKIRRKPRFDTQMPAGLIAGLVLIMLLLLWSLSPQPSPSPPPAPPAPAPPPIIVIAEPKPDGCPRGCETRPPDCYIKGNISLRTGERIYHLPGQQYYERPSSIPRTGRGGSAPRPRR